MRGKKRTGAKYFLSLPGSGAAVRLQADSIYPYVIYAYFIKIHTGTTERMPGSSSRGRGGMSFFI